MKLRMGAAGLAAALAVLGVLAVAASPAGAYTVPLHQQIITVNAPTSTSTYATVEAWQWQSSNGKYKRVA